jgi:hypothetical protein
LAAKFARPTHITLDFDDLRAPIGGPHVEIVLSVGVRLQDERLLDAYVTSTPAASGWTTSAKIELFDDGPEILWLSTATVSQNLTSAGVDLERATDEVVKHLLTLADSVADGRDSTGWAVSSERRNIHDEQSGQD